MSRRRIEEDPKKKDTYIKIYLLHFHFKKPWWEIAKMMNCSRTTITRAIKWVSKNFLKVPAKDLLQGAIFAIERRLEENTRLWKAEVEKKNPSIRSVVELNREIREDTKHLQNLQNLYREHYEVDVSIPLTSADILKLIQGKKPKE